MHIEIRRRGKKRLFYLAHSFRDNGGVRKIRRYLGADLNESDVAELRKPAEKAILEQAESYRRIRDPFHTVLSSREMGMVKALISKGGIKVRHLSDEEWKRFTEMFAYDTNAIEGSTVTSSEVRDILEEDRWPAERRKWEISETYGVSDAIKHMRKTDEHISLELVRKLHGLVFRNSKKFAGRFREKGVEVAVVDSAGRVIHRGAPQNQVESLLKELVRWYQKNKGRYHPIVLAAIVHNQFEIIHPFQDGNGRVGRLLLNNILMKHNLPPVNIELSNRKEYYSALQEYENNGNIRPTIELMLKEYRKANKHM